MGLPFPFGAAGDNHRPWHIARYDVDTDFGHLLCCQGSPYHARRLVVWNHKVKFEERNAGRRWIAPEPDT